jgi:CubicO group peptidase (beta-lactamase class C family)
VLVPILLLAGCGGGGAEPPLGGRLQQTLDHERAAQHIPGAAAAVVQNGRVVWVGASGLADVDAGARVHEDTEFAIASVTKPFVAQRVLELTDAGVLRLDDPLSRWLPRFPGARGIELRQLLNHTSGLDDYVTDGRFLAAERRRGVGYEWKPRQLLRFIPSRLAAPGERYSYSNANYLLLGLVIEQATRKRLDAQLPPEFVFQPRERPGADAAVGYLDGRPSPDNPFLPSRETASSAWGSGNLVATAGDLAHAGDALLRAAQRRGMTQWVPAIGDAQEYGLGLMHIRLAGQEAWGHSGDIAGFHADLWYLPARDVTVVALVNRDITTDRRRLVEALARVATSA